MNLERFWAAMYVSEIFYSRYQRIGCVYSKARSMVVFDRVMAEQQGVGV